MNGMRSPTTSVKSEDCPLLYHSRIFSLDLLRVVLSREIRRLSVLSSATKKSNKSPILKLLLSRLDELVARVSKREKA